MECRWHLANSALALLATATSLPANSATTFEVTVEFDIASGDVALLPIENTASVVGVDPIGNTITGQDTALLDVDGLIGDNGGPALDVEKDGGIPSPVSGQPGVFEVDFVVEISNPGDETVFDLVMVDDLAASMGGVWTDFTVTTVAGVNVNTESAATINANPTGNWLVPGQSLAAGASARVEFTVSFDSHGDFGPYTNLVTVTGENALGGTLSAESTEAVEIQIDVPGASIDKELVSTEVLAQNQFRSVFTLQVTNGAQDLTDAIVSDPMFSNEWVFATSSAVVTGVQLLSEDTAGTWDPAFIADGSQIAELRTGTGSVGYWPAEDSATFQVTVEYTVDNLGEMPITNVATVTGIDQLGDTQESSDAKDITIDDLVGDTGGPGLIVDKDGGLATSVDPATGTYSVDFSVSVRNPTEETVFDLELIDDLDNTLAVGAWTITSVSDPVGQNVTTNTAVSMRSGAAILADQTSNWFVPQLDLPSQEEILVTFTVEFTAAGDLGPYTNVVDVTGENALGQRTITGRGTEDVQIEVAAGLAVDKELVSTEVLGQGSFRSVFTLNVASDAEVMSNVELLDDLFNGWTAAGTTATVTGLAELSTNVPGAWTLTATPLANGSAVVLANAATLPANSATTVEVTIEYDVASGDIGLLPIENTATVDGTDPAGNTVTSEDTALVTADDLVGENGGPALDVEKDGGIPSPVVGQPGVFEVDFVVEISNPGDEAIFDLVMIDDLAVSMGGVWSDFTVTSVNGVNVTTESTATINANPADNWLVAGQSLPAGASARFEFTISFQSNGDTGPYTNIVTVTGEDALGTAITADSTEEVEIVTNPGASIDKELVSTEVLGQGEFRSVFTLQVTNGAEDLTSAIVSDPLFTNEWVFATSSAVVTGVQLLNEDTAGTWDPAFVADGSQIAELRTGTGSVGYWPAEDSATFQVTVEYTVDNVGELPITNVATVEGIDPLGNTQESSDAKDITADDLTGDQGGPGILVDKDGGDARPVAGQSGTFEVDFSVTVRNPTEETVFDLELIDDLNSTMGAGAWTITGVSDPVGQNTTTNTAVSLRSGAAILGDQTSNWFVPQVDLPSQEEILVTFTVEFEVNGDLGPYTNVVDVTGEDALGVRSVSGQGTEDVQILVDVAGASIDKELVSTEVLGQGEFRSVFTLQVTNGAQDLTNAIVSDPLFSNEWVFATSSAVVTGVQLLSEDTSGTWDPTFIADGSQVAVLRTGTGSVGYWPAEDSATFQITVEYTVDNVGELPITNVATVEGVDLFGETQSSSDAKDITADDLTGDQGGPGLLVDKDGGDARPVAGQSGTFEVDFSVTVRNPTEETVFDLELIDDLNSTMGAGAWTITGVSDPVGQNTTTNTAVSLRSGAAILGDQTSNWFVPQVDLPSQEEILVTFTVEFEVNGDLGPYTNVVDVTGEDALGVRSVSGQGTEDVQILVDVAGASIDKELVSTEVLGQGEFRSVFTLQVTNGAQDLTNAIVSDPLFTNEWVFATSSAVVTGVQLLSEDTSGTWDPTFIADGSQVAVLRTGTGSVGYWPAEDSATFQVTVEYTVDNVGELPITNVATVEGVDLFGETQSSSDAKDITADDLTGDQGGPGLLVDKDGGDARPVAGQSGTFEVDFSVTVRNPTEETVFDLELIDDLDTTMGAGAWTITGVSDPVGQNTTTNTAVSLRSGAAILGDQTSNWFVPQLDLPSQEEILVTFTVEFEVNGDLGPYTNVVDVTGEDALGVRSVSGQGTEDVQILVDVAGASIDKELVSTEVLGQGEFRSVFTLQVTNGAQDLTNAIVSDPLFSNEWVFATSSAVVTPVRLPAVLICWPVRRHWLPIPHWLILVRSPSQFSSSVTQRLVLTPTQLSPWLRMSLVRS